ncbi:MAG: hypothetical protein WBM44_24495 [Waterburya sp.]
MNQHNHDYAKIYLEVYCTLLAESEAAGFIQSNPCSQDRDRARAIAKLAGVYADAIVEYLVTNLSRELESV